MTDACRPLLAWLMGLCHGNASPEEASRQLTEIRKRFPELTLDLAWEFDHISDAYIYSLLCHDDGLVCGFSVSPRRATPWPLRGASPLDANALITVDGYSLRVGEAIPYVDLVLRRTGLITELVDMALIAAEASGRESNITETRVAAAVETFFNARALTTPTARQCWLDERGLTQDRLANLLRDVLQRRETEQLVAEQESPSQEYAPEEFVTLRLACLSLLEDLVDDAERSLASRQPGNNLWQIALALMHDANNPLNIEIKTCCRYQFVSRILAESPATEGRLLLARDHSGEALLIQELSVGATPTGTELAHRRARRRIEDWYRLKRATAQIEWNWGSATSGIFKQP